LFHQNSGTGEDFQMSVCCVVSWHVPCGSVG